MTKLEAILAGDGRSFEDVGAARAAEIEKPNPHHWEAAGSKSPPNGATDNLRTTALDVDQAKGDQAGPDREGSHE
jgi:hypothetical protein